ncbi:hypothetical protein HaLaN_26296 [Haematococcus lacustris]|uniref:Uncharacterized protein n=1 Tax=Haematococcus lacustris TaxID=44745 RepID=A0A6A0A5Y1_HAELA|nr:hypothetical protein HaLaN_26296 [Haematococcus lacustris]
MDGDLMRPPSRPPRLDGVAESQRCRQKGNVSAPSPPHRVQPVRRLGTPSRPGQPPAVAPSLEPAAR